MILFLLYIVHPGVQCHTPLSTYRHASYIHAHGSINIPTIKNYNCDNNFPEHRIPVHSYTKYYKNSNILSAKTSTSGIC